ncbi:terminase small subunit [Pseudomonas sp. C2B4]|uniref:terminase small subunit n=1 Tax=Pseudomonas sp. C2B4 TaxID=2735270 RepID=UPI0015865C80|nr:terminase small subunit [Pseudomonas sp. C2B4]NUU35184.1 terminase small subunit [Pseudomonas sp. C2B4]
MSATMYLSKSAFAAHIGRSPSYITWLKENGRLVLSPNGKQVDVLATEALIRDTADPSKAAVAARHQQQRLQRDVYSHVSAQSESTITAAPPPVDEEQGQLPDFQKARAHREHYLARMAEMEFRKAQGELVEISFVQKAAYETSRSLNQSLMSLSPQLAPQLAALSDSWEVERQLTAALRQRLNEAAQVSTHDFGFALDES